MNAVHLHLIVNHLPVVGVLCGLLLVAVALWRANDEVVRAGLWVVVVSALLVFPTLLTGDEAEDVVKRMPGFVKQTIHDHEEAAEGAAVAMGIAGAASLIGIFLGRRGPVPRRWAMVCVALAVIAAAMIARAANLGGQIRHDEIRAEAAAAGGSQPAPGGAPD